MNDVKCSFLVLDFRKELETRNCLESIKKHALFPHKVIYLDNGANDEEYPNQLYKEGLCDVLIRKKNGMGGGYGQVDLFHYCDTPYAFFVQNDQELIVDITQEIIDYFIDLLENKGFSCVDLNGDQSQRGIWTDRAHFIKTDFFNNFAPFPCGGPGLDNLKWNEQYLQEKFRENNYKIAHIRPLFFKDLGKFSIRTCGKNREGITVHRTDNKQMWVILPLKEKCDIFPPLLDEEFDDMIHGKWPIWGKDEIGRVPSKWKSEIFYFF